MDVAPQVVGGFQAGHRKANLLLGAVPALFRNAPISPLSCGDNGVAEMKLPPVLDHTQTVERDNRAISRASYGHALDCVR